MTYIRVPRFRSNLDVSGMSHWESCGEALTCGPFHLSSFATKETRKIASQVRGVFIFARVVTRALIMDTVTQDCVLE